MKNVYRQARQEQMYDLIERWQSSKQTAVDFCKGNGVSKANFYYWLKKYREGQAQTPEGFVSLKIIGKPADQLEVHYPNLDKPEPKRYSIFTLTFTLAKARIYTGHSRISLLLRSALSIEPFSSKWKFSVRLVHIFNAETMKNSFLL